jgi:hypothetical protein
MNAKVARKLKKEAEALSFGDKSLFKKLYRTMKRVYNDRHK